MIRRVEPGVCRGPVFGVLVVDDEYMVRRVTVRLLQSAGFRTHEAEDGPRALEILGQESPPAIHAVILDWSMPGMNGESTFRAIRSLRPHLPITVSTGWEPEEARQRLADFGRVVVLQKPFDGGTLALTVRGQIEAQLARQL